MNKFFWGGFIYIFIFLRMKGFFLFIDILVSLNNIFDVKYLIYLSIIIMIIIRMIVIRINYIWK